MKIITLILSLFLFLNNYGQQKSKVNQIELISDIQIWDKDNDKMKLSFWIPSSYWRISLEGNSDISEEIIEKIESTFDDYMVLCLADIEVNGDNLTYTSKSDLEKTATIIDKNKKSYTPLSDEVIPHETNEILKSIKPMFAQMFGQLGKGMHFFLFKVKYENNENIINEFKEGEFIVKHSGKEFKWTLPLPALLPNKYCPIDNEEMKGNWVFCPFHGEKLNN
ncbi:hypothetical protein [Aureibaculum conchae]|uniref:hypothetical protein n=1 Tax=Aureibaculum sp. 2308TA14-22 TaxID=3108392 RepID=UPI00339853DD